MKEALITVVIPCYNREKMIAKAIQSVMNQTAKTPWKLLIIDDASTDRSVEKIKSFLHDERIQLIQMEKNVGISSVMNKALDCVDTPYFVQLDSDDWLEKHTLREFTKAIKKVDHQTALFYGNMNIVRRKRGGWKSTRYIRHRSFKDKYDFLQYLTYMLHPRLFRTEAVRQVGGWETHDPHDGRIMEDRRICLKLIEKYPFYWIDKPLYNRRKHQQQLTSRKSLKSRNIMRKQTIEFYLKKWGDEYKPIYQYRDGLLVIKKLVKKKKGGTGHS